MCNSRCKQWRVWNKSLVSYLLYKSWKMRDKSLTKGFSTKYNFSSSFRLHSFVMIFPQECDLYVHIYFLYSRRNKQKKQYSESGEKSFCFSCWLKIWRRERKRGIDCLFLEDQPLYFQFVFNLVLTNSFSIYLHS